MITPKYNAFTNIAKTSGKPEGYVAVQVNSGLAMSFGGNQKPCAVLRFEGIGGIGAGKNGAHSRALTEAVSRALEIDSSRIYIVFRNVEASSWGHNGTTFG
ncbi:hypothetical protein GJ496_003933 [Pomphorhynchus laevis]|nr:hypothetical protein GJ496_003933 [Pomphorhynchus laevis]